MSQVQLAAGLVACGFVGLLGAIVLWKIASDRIDITYVISEANGDASMSRFQLLIFTFVIAMSFFLVVVGNGETAPRFPETIPAGVLTLLGISASSYLVSKGINTSAGSQVALVVNPTAVTLPAGGVQQFTAQAINLSTNVRWSISPPQAGFIAANGLYTAPAAVPARQVVTVTATSDDDPAVSAVAVVTLV